MNQNEAEGDARNDALQQLFNRAKPKARYISQSHIEQQTNSITKQIINGDIEINKNKSNLNQLAEKNTYEDMLRRKYMQQIEREKEQLQHRLGYIENSLNSYQKYQFLRKRSSMQEGLTFQKDNKEEWRKDYQDEMKKIQLKKKQIAEKSKEKEIEAEQLRAKVREQEKVKRKAQLEQSVKRYKDRTQKRQQTGKEENQKLKQILSKKELYQKLQERYHQKEQDILQQRKKKLAQIRQLKQPINLQQILDHQQRVLQTMKQKEALRNRQKIMNNSRTKSYRPSYQSAFYKQLANHSQQQITQNPKQKIQKMRQFSQQVKNKFVPEIDQRKRKQMEDKLQKQIKSRSQRDQKDRQLLQKAKVKGLEYLQLVKRMPKKKQNGPPLTAPINDRIEYKNYLGSLSVDMGKPKPWKTILTKGDHKVDTALMLQIQSEKTQQKLKRKEQYSRVMKLRDNGQIDQQYFEMVKAKLSLLAKD